MKLALAAVALLALTTPSQAQRASISAQCANVYSRLADPGTGTVDAEDAAELLGDEFVTGQDDLSQAEFMSACMASRQSGSGSGSGESGGGSPDDDDR